MDNRTFFDDKARDYEVWFRENEYLYQAELEAVRKVVPVGKRGIEIGVGTGIFAKPLQISEGVEPSEKMAELAEKKGIHVIRAAAEALPIVDRSFDFALMVTVDCFLMDVERAFREVSRVLVPGGTFVIAFIDLDTELGQLYEKGKSESLYYKSAEFHTHGQIEKLLGCCGFRVKSKYQTVFSLENCPQPVKEGVGEGVFAVIEAVKP